MMIAAMAGIGALVVVVVLIVDRQWLSTTQLLDATNDAFQLMYENKLLVQLRHDYWLLHELKSNSSVGEEVINSVEQQVLLNERLLQKVRRIGPAVVTSQVEAGYRVDRSNKQCNGLIDPTGD